MEAENFIDRAADLTDIEPEFDSIVTDPSLKSTVPAATRFQKKGLYERTDFVENPYAFQKLSEGEKLNASAHEILESKQMNGFLGDELKQTHQISDDFADFLNYAQTEFPNDIREGMTQALTNKMLPNGEATGRNFYPKQTDIFESLVEHAGFDLEEELFKEAKQEIGGRESSHNGNIYSFGFVDGFYYEKGGINGFDYEFMAVGDKIGVYGPEIAKKYKDNLSNYLRSGAYTENSRDNQFGDYLEDFGRYWSALENAYDEQAEYSAEDTKEDHLGGYPL